MDLTFRRLGLSELLPRYLFAESLFARRRVLEVGAVATTAGASAKFLSERGARWVVACDDDLGAVEEAQRTLGTAQLRFRPLVFDDLEPKAFDVILVADLAPYVRAPELFKELALRVAPHGFLIGGLRNISGLALAQLQEPEPGEAPPTCGQLLDVLKPDFPWVELATQSPVLGYQLAFQTAEGLLVDGSLAETGESAYYVVFAGQQAPEALDPTWVQLPPSPLAFTGNRIDELARRSREWEERCAKLKELLAGARSQVQEKERETGTLLAQLEAARDDAAKLSAQLESVRSQGEYARDRDELALKVRRAESDLRVSQQRLADADKRTGQLEAQLAALQQTQADLQSQLLAAQEATRLERARREEQVSVVEDARGRYGRTEEELRRLAHEAQSAREERDQAWLAKETAVEHSKELERELFAAREREVRLAEQHSASLTAMEHLQNEASTARREARSAAAMLEKKEAEFASALRGAEADANLVAQAKEVIEGERSEFKKQLQSKDERLATLETDLLTARSSASRALDELEQARARGARLKSLSEELEQKLGLQRDDNERFSRQIAELEAQVTEERARAEGLERDNLQGLTARLEMLEQERDRFASEAMRDREAWAAEQRAWSAQQEASAAEREALTAQADQLAADIDALSAQHAGEMEALRVRHASDLQGEQTRTAQRIQQLEQERSQWEKAQSEVRAELDQVRRQHEKQARQTETTLVERDSQVGELRTLVEGYESEIRGITEERDRIAREIDRLESSRAQLQSELEAYRAEVERLQDLQSQALPAQEPSDELAQEVLTLKEALAESQSLAAQQAETIGEGEAKLELFQRRLNAQETELSVLRRALGRTPAAPVQKIYERASAEISAVKAELLRRPASKASTGEPAPPRTPNLALEVKSDEPALPGGSPDKPK